MYRVPILQGDQAMHIPFSCFPHNQAEVEQTDKVGNLYKFNK